jgi:type VI secretion system secreted protein Hcp
MAFDTFLDIKEVPGESTAKGFEGKTEIYSFSWGASNPATIGSGTGGGGAGKVSISSFNIMKRSDAASPLLFQACCRGDHYPTAIVTMRKAGGTGGQTPFLIYTFTTVYVDSIQWSGSSGGDDTPTESVSFSFGKVEVEYKPQAKTGAAAPKPILAAWDLTTVSDK